MLLPTNGSLVLEVWRYINKLHSHVEGILPKGPYLPCVSMAGRALLAGYLRCIDHVSGTESGRMRITYIAYWEIQVITNQVHFTPSSTSYNTNSVPSRWSMKYLASLKPDTCDNVPHIHHQIWLFCAKSFVVNPLGCVLKYHVALKFDLRPGSTRKYDNLNGCKTARYFTMTHLMSSWNGSQFLMWF